MQAGSVDHTYSEESPCPRVEEALFSSSSSSEKPPDDDIGIGDPAGGGKGEDLPSERTLDRVAAAINNELSNIFVNQPEPRLYHPNIVLEDRYAGHNELTELPVHFLSFFCLF